MANRMSRQLKVALLGLLVLPLVAVWFFWARADEVGGASAARESRAVAASPSAAPPVAPPAPAQSAANVGASAAPGLVVGDSETARLTIRHRPAFLKGVPLGCDPPYTVDVEGNKHYKKECF
jgi:hypothetical protein